LFGVYRLKLLAHERGFPYQEQQHPERALEKTRGDEPYQSLSNRVWYAAAIQKGGGGEGYGDRDLTRKVLIVGQIVGGTRIKTISVNKQWRRPMCEGHLAKQRVTKRG